MKISEQRWEATEAFDGDMHIGAFVTCDDEEICLADTAELADAIAHLPDIVRELNAQYKRLQNRLDITHETGNTEVCIVYSFHKTAEEIQKLKALLERLGEKP